MDSTPEGAATDLASSWLHLPWLHTALTIIGLALAGVVTLHVLRTKRDVAASIGWIGLVWLSPLLGAIFYVLLGINRVRRLAQRIQKRRDRRGAFVTRAARRASEAGHAQLVTALTRLTGRPLLGGNTVAILADGDEAYPRMVAAIEAAHSTVGLCSYIFRDDAAGGPVIDALIAAHRRGVGVRVLIDGIGAGYFRAPAARRLRASGVAVQLFMHSPLPWRMPFLNLRTHKKILVVDGDTGFTGGINIGAENLLASRPAHPVRDTHFHLTGPVVAQLVDTFVRDWSLACGENLDEPGWYPEIAEAGPAAARVVTSGPDSDIEKIEFALLQAISVARSRVLVMTPYFLPDERVVTALSLAAMRGVAVCILLPRRSNHRLVDWAMWGHVWPLLRAGVSIRFNDGDFDHSKLMVVDDDWSLVGSANWDMRSLRLNFEIDVEIYDVDLATRLAARIEALCGGRLTEHDLAARPRWAKLRDAALRLGLPYL